VLHQHQADHDERREDLHRKKKGHPDLHGEVRFRKK
jgi:hypothetical protein